MTIKQILTDSREMLGDRKGATAIEYGLIAAAIALVLVAAMPAIGTALDTTFGKIETQLKE